MDALSYYLCIAYSVYYVWMFCKSGRVRAIFFLLVSGGISYYVPELQLTAEAQHLRNRPVFQSEARKSSLLQDLRVRRLFPSYLKCVVILYYSFNHISTSLDRNSM